MTLAMRMWKSLLREKEAKGLAAKPIELLVTTVRSGIRVYNFMKSMYHSLIADQ